MVAQNIHYLYLDQLLDGSGTRQCQVEVQVLTFLKTKVLVPF